MTPPQLLVGETIAKHPLRVEPDPVRDREEKREWLHYSSRINFGKVYTVEHNVKVMGIGKIGDECLHLLHGYFQLAVAS